MEEKHVLTINGPQPIPNNFICLTHEYLNPCASSSPSKPLNLENIHFHRQQPFSLENASVTPSLIEHEIITNYDPTSLLVVDCSQNKAPEIFNKFHVVKGYQFAMPKSFASEKEKQTIMNTKHILKELAYQFDHSTGIYRPGFLGEIDLSSFISNQHAPTILEAYSQFSQETGCPIFMNALPLGKKSYAHCWNFHSQIEYPSLNFPILYEKVKDLSKIVLFNPFILLNSKEKQGGIFETSNVNENQILKLYEAGMIVGYDLLRYQEEYCLRYIAKYAKKFPSQTILCAGIRYKTDLQIYGGDGINLTKTTQFLDKFLDQSIKKMVLHSNMIELLRWFTKKVVVKQIKTWACCKCGKQFPETTDAFRKFGKDFCSIDCVRSYKF